MAVALDAAHGEPLENLPCGDIPIHRSEQAELLVVGSALVVRLGEPVEGGGEFLVQRGARDQVAGELLDDELVVGKIAVEGLDDPVAVFPDIAVAVVAEAFGIGIARQVHPDGSPALPEGRGGEKAVGFLFDGGGEILGGGGFEGIQLGDGGREAGEVEGCPAQPFGRGCSRRRLEVFAFKPREDEMVDFVHRPFGILHLRRFVSFRSSERPVLAPRRTFCDPSAECLDIRIAEAWAVLGLRHEIIFIIRNDAGDHFGKLGLAGDDDGFSRLTLAQHLVAENEGNIARLFDSAVASDAVFVQNGLDVPVEIDSCDKGRGKEREMDEKPEHRLRGYGNPPGLLSNRGVGGKA